MDIFLSPRTHPRTDFETTSLLIYGVIMFFMVVQFVEVFAELHVYNGTGFMPLQNDTMTNLFDEAINFTQNRCQMNCYQSCSMYDLMLTASVQIIQSLWSFSRTSTILIYCLTQKTGLLLRSLVA